MSDALLPFVVLGPLLGAAVAVASARAAAITAVVTAAGLLGAVAALSLYVLDHGTVTHAAGAWGAPLGIVLRADGLAVLLLATTAVIGCAITGYATAYFQPIYPHEPDRGLRFFWPLWLLVWAALNAIFVSTDIFNLYVCLELLTLPAVALVALDGTRAAIVAALRYLLLSLAGSLIFLLGVAIVYSGAGTLALPLIAAAGLDPDAARLALAAMTVGLAIKAALFPVHFWLPPAHAGAPAPASAILSALVVKAAFYIMLRLWTDAFPGALATPGATLLGVLGAAAVVWGSLLALRQTRVKLIIACSTVAQVGYLFLIFPLLAGAPAAAWSGGMYHLLSHALAKAALFLAAGNMIRAFGDDELSSIAGVGQKLPITFAAFGIAGLNLVGMPPSGGFIAKWLLLTAALTSGQWWWAVVLAAGSLLAAGYVVLVLRAAFLLPRAAALRQQPPLRMTGAALALALIALGLGIWAEVPLALLGDTAPGLAPRLAP
jgi:multicomponent Na+:H+ antiporter subunit D